MEEFLNDDENAHDSVIMKYVSAIVQGCVIAGPRVDYLGLIKTYYASDPDKIPILFELLEHIRVGYPTAINAVITFCVRMRNLDFVHTIFDTIYTIWSDANASRTTICPSGYMNNIVIMLPSIFPSMFEETPVVPVPLIVEEIYAIIDLAAVSEMTVNEFRFRIMYYADRYSDIPMIVEKCTELVKYYTAAYSGD